MNNPPVPFLSCPLPSQASTCYVHICPSLWKQKYILINFLYYSLLDMNILLIDMSYRSFYINTESSPFSLSLLCLLFSLRCKIFPLHEYSIISSTYSLLMNIYNASQLGLYKQQWDDSPCTYGILYIYADIHEKDKQLEEKLLGWKTHVFIVLVVITKLPSIMVD